MVRKDAWNDFNCFEFTKAIFMAPDVVYHGEANWRCRDCADLVIRQERKGTEERSLLRMSPASEEK